MLFALGQPFSLLVLLASFVVGMTVHGWVQSVVADRLGDRRPRQEFRLSPDARRHLDPFGCVAAALSGLGWARPVEAPRRSGRGALLAVTLSGPLVNIGLGLGLLFLARAQMAGSLLSASYALQRGLGGSFALAPALVLAGASQLYLGVLSLVPLPPLDGGRLLFGLAPRSGGWQRAEHVLVEQNVGTIALLALLIIPLGQPLPVLPSLLDTLLAPVLRAIGGV